MFKFLSISLFTIALIQLNISCSDENNTDTPSLKVNIISINPVTAAIGEIITIQGTNLGDDQDVSYASFNGTLASEYLSWSDSLIKVKIPVGATSGKLWIVVGIEKSNELDFTVKALYYHENVTIGKQVWMTKNLDVDHYRNGDPIPQVTDPNEWITLKTGAWCYYNNDPANGEIYGKLYNWYAVNDPRGLAPKDWHIPTDAELTELENCLGDYQVAGGKLKKSGTIEGGNGLWRSPYKGASNEYGFSALPGGDRNAGNGTFEYIGYRFFCWSASDWDDIYAWSRYLSYKYTDVGRAEIHKREGFSVRCIKN